MSPVSIADFKDRFDFHCRIAGQGGNANRRAGVAALFPKKINEQLRSTVDDQWDVMETRGHVDEAVHAYTANYPGHIAINGVTQRCQQVQCARSEEHTSELQSRPQLVCRLLPEKKKHLSVN